MKEEIIDSFIKILQEKIECEKQEIKASLSSGLYIRENYERTLRLNGMHDALILAMAHVTSLRKKAE